MTQKLRRSDFDSDEAFIEAKYHLRENEQEIKFLRQTIQARKVLATLPEPKPAVEMMQHWQAAPATNGQRGTLRLVTINSLKLGDDQRTSVGKVVRRKVSDLQAQIDANDAEIARLKAELGR